MLLKDTEIAKELEARARIDSSQCKTPELEVIQTKLTAASQDPIRKEDRLKVQSNSRLIQTQDTVDK